jgi:hypothetical protein
MSVTLEVMVPDDGEQTFVHRFRNFGEDVYRALRDECDVSIHEIDASTTSFMIRAIKRRQARRTAARIREIAENHFFGGTIVITEK